MDIATTEIERLITINHDDGCTKTTKINKFHTGNTNKLVLRSERVEFRFPDGTIDKDRTNYCKLLIEESYEYDYLNLSKIQKLQMVTTITYIDGSTQTITKENFTYPNGKRAIISRTSINYLPKR